jgi:hypothetical protein
MLTPKKERPLEQFLESQDDKNKAWRRADVYAEELVERGLAPQWLVKVRVLSVKGRRTYGIYLVHEEEE